MILICTNFDLQQDAASDLSKAFLQIAGETDDVPFGVTASEDVFSEYKVSKDAIVLFKKVSYC